MLPRVEAPIPVRSSNFLRVPTFMRDHRRHIVRALPIRVTDEINCVAGDAGLPLSVGENHREDRVSHAGFAMVINLVCKSNRKPGWAVLYLYHILYFDESFTSIILRIYTPPTQVGNFRLDIYGVENPAIPQRDAAGEVPQLVVPAGDNASQSFADVVWEDRISQHQRVFWSESAVLVQCNSTFTASTPSVYPNGVHEKRDFRKQRRVVAAKPTNEMVRLLINHSEWVVLWQGLSKEDHRHADSFGWHRPSTASRNNLSSLALGDGGKVLLRRKFTQKQLAPAFTANLQTSPDRAGGVLEAHFLGRALRKQGHDVKLLPAQLA